MPNWKKLIVSGSDASLNSLNVTNNVTAQSFTGSFSGSFTAPGATTQVVYNNGGALAASSNFVFSGSRVGIGTASPNSILEISQATPIIRIESSDVNQFHGIEFRNGTNLDSFIKQLPSSGEFRISNGRSVGWGGHITFYTDTVERLRITPAGNVGIGTSSPGAKLDVNGNSKFVAGFSSYTADGLFGATALPGVYVNTPGGNSRGTYLGYRDFGSGDYYGRIGVSGSVAWSLGISNSTGTNFSIGLNNNTATDYFTVVSGSGNVGIGTTSPGAKLEIEGNSYTTGLRISNTTSHSTNLFQSNTVFNINSQFVGDSISIQPADYLSISTYSGGIVERLRVLNNGNVGIGTTSPTATLEVNGNVKAVSFTGSLSGSATNAVSASYALTSSYAFTASYVNPLNQDLIVTGSVIATSLTASNALITGNLSVLGTASFVYTTASVVTIGGNLITLNTDNPSVRFAGITVVDSGSFGNSSTGSLFWDSQNNRWIYSNPSGSSYDGGMFISGPRNTSGLGNEQGTTLNAILKGQGGDHLTSSGMFEDSSGNVGVGTASPSAKFEVVGNVKATSFTGSFSGSVSAPGSTTQIVYNSGGALAADSGLVYSGSNVGIGISSPTEKLHIVSSATGNQFGRITATDSTASAAWVAQNDQGDNVVYRVFGSGVSGTQMGNALGRSASLLANLGGSGVFLLGTFSNTDFILGTNNTERMRILSSGNVGIGTTNPIYKLQVAGSTYVNGGTLFLDSGEYIRWGNSAQGIRGVNDTSLEFVAGSSTRMYVSASGDVGIGTTSPGLKLDVVSGASGNPVLRLQSTDTNGYSGAHLYSSAGTLTGHFGWANGSSSALSDKMYFGTIVNKPVVFTTNDAEKVRIAADGNVGIGTTNPAYKLDVVSSNSLIARFNGSAVAASSATEIDVLGPQSNGELNLGVGGSTLSDSTNNIQNKGFITAGSGLDGLNLRSDQGYVQITAGGITPANEVARFTAGGNVGIGTSSPSQKLSVVGAVSASTYYGDGSNLTNIGSGSVAAAGSDGQLQYNNGGSFGGASRLYYNDSSNRVGIGISTPGYDLDVSGSARVQDRLRVGTINSGNGVVHESTDATINPSGAQVVWTISGTAAICTFMEYYVFNTNTNTSQRAGTIVLTWNQSGTPTITHTETSTPDIGSTSAITFTSTLTLGGDPQLIATNTSGDPWYMIMNYRYF